MNKAVTLTPEEFVSLKKENESLEKVVEGYEESYEVVLDFIHEHGLFKDFKEYLQDRMHASSERLISFDTYMGFVEGVEAKMQ
ncbi:hypothetical protein [Paenibacillus sp. JJ1722]|uniref:hypothetical protein n=1 Tax=Paenibacillus sp. JJ1722 TaxID=3398770 RepID=UPI003AB0C938